MTASLRLDADGQRRRRRAALASAAVLACCAGLALLSSDGAPPLPASVLTVEKHMSPVAGKVAGSAAEGTTVKCVFIRHGESTWNLRKNAYEAEKNMYEDAKRAGRSSEVVKPGSKPSNDQEDAPLTPQGVRDAQAAGMAIRQAYPDMSPTNTALMVSNLDRAQQGPSRRIGPARGIIGGHLILLTMTWSLC